MTTNLISMSIYANYARKRIIKLHALARISTHLDSRKLRIIMKTFIDSQFNYCPLICIFHSRALNNKINILHKRALRIVYKNSNLSFQELLTLDKSVSIHHRNLQKLATEMYKIKNNIGSLSDAITLPQPWKSL